MSQTMGAAGRPASASPQDRVAKREPARRSELELAVHQVNVGDLAGATRRLHALIATDPEVADALHLLGLIAEQRGDLPEGVELIRRAMRVRPNDAVLSNNLAAMLLSLDRAEEAASVIAPALAASPGYAALHYNLGNALRRIGRTAQACEAYRATLRINPAFNDAAINLAATLLDGGEQDEAEHVATEALKRAPQSLALRLTLGSVLASGGRHAEALPHFEAAAAAGFGDARHRLGRCLLSLGRAAQAQRVLERGIAGDTASADLRCDLGVAHLALDANDAAVRCFREALARAPSHAPAEANLCDALRRTGALNEAITSGERATRLAPLMPLAWLNLGVSLLDADRPIEARAALARALALDPASALAENAHGSALEAAGDSAAALAAYDRALALQPEYHEARFNRGLAELKRGDFANGWADYEARRALRTFPPAPEGATEWDGEALNGRTLVLFTEQGYGDTLQFVRFAPLVAALGGKVVLACQRPLVRLLDGAPGLDRVLPIDAPLPRHDLIAPLMTVPFRLGVTLETLPVAVPYITPPPALTLDAPKDTLRIGIAWAGSAANRINRRRSCPLVALAPLAARDDVRLFSLQVGSEAGALRHVPFGHKVTDLTPGLDDFRDTAAAMMGLDLVLTIDTATAHLAGALGVPVWVMLSTGGDWRYLDGRTDSPWYPTMRLFRQTGAGDWAGVIKQVCEALEPPARP